MPARVLTRTHYQVAEPAYVATLIRHCSSPAKSEYPERLSQRLTDRLKSLDREFNLAAARYCVDLARSLSLLTENNFWTDLGHTLNLISPTSEQHGSSELQFSLSNEERMFFFRIFLEYDGAALIFLAQLASADGTIPTSDKDWNSIANEMMKFVYSSYLDIVTTDFRERAFLRQQLTKRVTQPYAGKSGPHQCFVHLQTMARIGLLQSRFNGTRREYTSANGPPGQIAPLDRFLKLVPNVKALEEIIANRGWPHIAAQVFDTSGWAFSKRWSDLEILTEMRGLYEHVMTTGVSLCSLKTLIETVQVKQIAAAIAPVTYDEGMNILRDAQAGNPKRVRFHVDRLGRPAFIIFS